MKIHRYGNPHYKAEPRFADLSGQRFGMLVALSRQGNRWLCRCDCGETTLALVGDLNRGSKASCGDRVHTRRADAGYGAAHSRVRRERGSASTHRCVDCDGQARHWSYNHQDAAELISSGEDYCSGLPYSLNPWFYEPRCVPCHKTFDLGRLGGNELLLIG